MAEVVVIGTGLSGTLMAYEMLPKLRREDRLTVISQGPVYHFVPSNPWVAIGWRKRSDIEIDLVDIMSRKGIRRGEIYERFLLDKLNIAKVKEVEPAA